MDVVIGHRGSRRDAQAPLAPRPRCRAASGLLLALLLLGAASPAHADTPAQAAPPAEGSGAPSSATVATGAEDPGASAAPGDLTRAFEDLPADPAATPSVDLLLAWMTGDFDNAADLDDPARAAVEEHAAIVVHVRPLPGLEHALYMEQALAARPERPYRQRVYLLRAEAPAVSAAGEPAPASAPTFRSVVHELRDPSRFVNAHAAPDLLAAIGEEDLDVRPGCDVVMRWRDGRFVGSTEGEACRSTWGGAAWATAEVVIHPRGFQSLDRGWNAAGEQVWGAERRPYRFARRAPATARPDAP